VARTCCSADHRQRLSDRSAIAERAEVMELFNPTRADAVLLSGAFHANQSRSPRGLRRCSY
jgi:hypothetical protein